MPHPLGMVWNPIYPADAKPGDKWMQCANCGAKVNGQQAMREHNCPETKGDENVPDQQSKQ